MSERNKPRSGQVRPIPSNSGRKDTFRPGQRAPVSGRYEAVGPSGELVGEAVHVTDGDPFPPTPNKGQGYRLAKQIKTVHTTATSAAAIG